MHGFLRPDSAGDDCRRLWSSGSGGGSDGDRDAWLRMSNTAERAHACSTISRSFVRGRRP